MLRYLAASPAPTAAGTPPATMALAPSEPRTHAGDMHRPALAAAIAGRGPGDFGHHPVGIGTAGEEDRMAAMMVVNVSPVRIA